MKTASHKRVKTPMLLQMEASECGAVALGIILHYHRCYIPIESLRQTCNVSRDGTNALNIVRAAQHYGLEASGLRRTTITGLANLTPPYILHVREQHFVVGEGVDERYVYVNDPTQGHRALDHESFQNWYQGVVITCTPSDTFTRQGKPFELVGFVREWVRGAEAALVYVLLASVFLLVPGLMLPVLLQIFVDEVLARGRDWLGVVVIGLAVALVLRVGLLWLQQRMLVRLETRLSLRAANRLFEHLLNLPMLFFLNRYSGDLVYRLSITDRISGLLTHSIIETLLSLGLMIFYALIMLRYSVLLTVIGIGFVLANFVVLQVIARRRTQMHDLLTQQRTQLTGAILNGLRGLETLKAANAEQVLFTRWNGLNAASLSTEQSLNRLTDGYFTLIPFLLAINTSLVLVIGAWLVMRGDLTLGMLVAFQSLMFSFIQPVSQLAAAGSRFQEFTSDTRRVDDVLKYPSWGGRDDNVTPLLDNIGTLRLANVTFGYNAFEPPLLDRVAFKAQRGTVIAVRGSSGSGKSTLMRVLAGLYDPWDGEVYLNGLPARTQRHSISYADQSIQLFAGSFRDNIALWDESIPLQQIMQAARDACIHNVIMARGGYDALIDENGRDLSGGQRQCLEIARALVRDPLLLLLDETTNALDLQTEQTILNNLRRRDCICVLVAHRQSVLSLADHVITLDEAQAG